MTETSMIDEEWLEQLDGLRPLARRLVRDESRADDAVQRVLLKAMTSKGLPRARGFWARVIRNEAIDEQRAERTREHHEGRTRRDSTAPSAHAVVSEAESQGIVSNAVLALEEPYRTVILLRFFRGLKVRQIAVEVKRPTGTVQSQLDRGLVLLRQRLRHTFGDGRALALGLLPLATGKASLLSTPSAFLFLAPLAMKFAWLIPLLVLGLLGSRFWATDSEGLPGNHEEPLVASSTKAPLDPLGATEPIALSREGAPRVPVGNRRPELSEAPDSPPGLTSGRALIPGIARNVDGSPYANSDIEIGNKVKERRTVRTDPDGRFEYRAEDSVRAPDDSWLLVASKRTHALGEFLFAPTVRFAGQVVDEQGTPLPQVMLLDTGHMAQAGLDAKSGWSTAASTFNSPSGNGRFDLKGAATWPGRTVTFKHRVFGEHAVPVPSTDQSGVTIVFPGATAGYELLVRVVDSSGEPVEDAAVVFGQFTAAVDSNGLMRFDVDASTAGSEVVALRGGFAAVSQSAPTMAQVDEAPSTRTLTFTHSDRLAPIEGVVVDANGSPVPGAKVQAWNGRASGRGFPFAAVQVVEGQAEHRSVFTGQGGRFTLPRSSPGKLEVRAAARKPLRMGRASTSGEPVRIVLPAQESRSDLRGRVVDHNGDPVGGARVSVVARLHPALDGGRIRWDNVLRSGEQETSAEGAFEWLGVGGRDLEVAAEYLGVSAFEAIVPGTSDLTIELDLACEVDLSIASAPRGATLSVVNADGQPLRCQRHHGSFLTDWNGEQRISTEGATLLLRIPQSAREAQLIVEGVVMRTAILKPSRQGPTRVNL